MRRPLLALTVAGSAAAFVIAFLPARHQALGGPGNATAFRAGDANCDSLVDARDAVTVLRIDAGVQPPTPCLPAADADCDSAITSRDALAIARYAAQLPVAQPVGCPPIGSLPAPATPTPAPSAAPTPTETPAPSATSSPTPSPTSSPNAACTVFPPDNPWNTDVSTFPLDPLSDTYINSIGRADHLHPDFGTVWDGAPNGIPYAVVGADQPRVPVDFYYADESDAGPYPIPPDVPIEGGPNSGGDRHVIVLDDANCVLYEVYDAHTDDGGASWHAGSGAVFDLRSNALRPDYWTSADAAGLPIFAGLARYDEVVGQGEIRHALRFTVSNTQRAFIHPATHYASDSTDASLPPMGLRLRMKAAYDCSAYASEVQVICTALKRYGMIVADNGSDWYISGAPDPRWSDDRLGDMKDIPGDAFEVVDTGEGVVRG